MNGAKPSIYLGFYVSVVAGMYRPCTNMTKRLLAAYKCSLMHNPSGLLESRETGLSGSLDPSMALHSRNK